MRVKSLQDGKDILVSVENITSLGIWLFADGREYYLTYADPPYFREQTLSSIQDVQLLHRTHLYWPRLDVDLELDNLTNPAKYPLKSRVVAEAGSAEGSNYHSETNGRRGGKRKFQKVLKKRS